MQNCFICRHRDINDFYPGMVFAFVSKPISNERRADQGNDLNLKQEYPIK